MLFNKRTELGNLPRSWGSQIHPRARMVTFLAAEEKRRGGLHPGQVVGQPAVQPFTETDQFPLNAMLNSPVCGSYSAEGDYEQLNNFGQRIWLTQVIATLCCILDWTAQFYSSDLKECIAVTTSYKRLHPAGLYLYYIWLRDSPVERSLKGQKIHKCHKLVRETAADWICPRKYISSFLDTTFNKVFPTHSQLSKMYTRVNKEHGYDPESVLCLISQA